MPESARKWEYSIQTNISIIPLTYPQLGYTSHIGSNVDESWNDKYLMSGFSTMQLMADRFILNQTEPINTKMRHLAIDQLCDSIVPLLRLLRKHNSTRTDLESQYWKRWQNSSSQSNHHITCSKLVDTEARNLGLSLTPLTLPASYAPNDVRVAEFPTPKYTERDFYTKIENVFALCLVLTYLWPVVSKNGLILILFESQSICVTTGTFSQD